MEWSFGREQLGRLESGASREWLLTNGLGGWASGAFSGLNTRRYHGLLMAAANPPSGRWLLVNKLEEELLLRGKTFQLGVNTYRGALEPQGHLLLQEASFDGTMRFVYACEDVLLEKQIVMAQGANLTLVRYRQLSGPPLQLKARLWANSRDLHGDTHASPHFSTKVLQREGGWLAHQAFPEAPTLLAKATSGDFSGEAYWIYNVHYQEEAARGLQAEEDVFSPGCFEWSSAAGTSVIVALAADEAPQGNLDLLFAEAVEAARRPWRQQKTGFETPLARALLGASGAFSVRDPGDGRYLLAGYHWFGPWGRDTFIALPGLTLVTGRFEEAKALLSTLARHVTEGLVPNLVDEGGGAAYNTVDASLWFIWAGQKYLDYTGDVEYAKKELWPVLRDILASYETGTRYGIHADSDGLITAGDEGTQLTWMDAKYGDWVVTPRAGKAVEINALWYNALRFGEKLAALAGESGDHYGKLASRVFESFNQSFWYPEGGYLLDVIGPAGADASFRPNQVIAASLPFPVLDKARSRLVVEKAWQRLWTGHGLRSLAPDDPHYIGHYRGDTASRDGAYHRGTAWGWLAGPFFTAFRRAFGEEPWARETFTEFFAGFEGHLWEAGIGFVSEIFEGDAPHLSRGCIAQAWSVAELLRAWSEDYLGNRPDFWA